MTDFLDTGSVLFRKRHPKVGARPGTLMIGDQAVPPVVRMIGYDIAQVREQEIDDVEQLTVALEEQEVAWVDVQGFGDEALIRRIGEIFQIHPLALEDIVNMPQRPKTESYEGQVLIITRMARINANAIDMEQVSILMGKGYVITFQERYGDILDPVRERIRHGKGRPIRRSGTDYLSYAIVDTIIDGYYPVIESIGDHLEQLEGFVMRQPTPGTLQELNQTKNLTGQFASRDLASSRVRQYVDAR